MNSPTSSPGKRQTKLGVLVLVLVGTGSMLWFLRSQETFISTGDLELLPSEGGLASSAHSNPEDAMPSPAGSGSESSVYRPSAVDVGSSLRPAPSPGQAAYPPVAPTDPEEQPRAVLSLDLIQPDEPSMYRLNGLSWTGRGLQLADASRPGQLLARTSGPPPSGIENDIGTPTRQSFRRAGVLESAPLPLMFPANALTPLWKAELLDGMALEVEIRVSPDGVVWGKWHTILPSPDSTGQISPTYPDGRRNPNYGYTPGATLLQGLRLFQVMSLRITLGSNTDASPVLSSLRIFYQDTTLGKGAWMEGETLLESPP